MGEKREQLKFSAWRVQPRIDAGTAVWVCEKGHVDDYHVELTRDVEEAAALCSRCGGRTALFSLDQLAYAIRRSPAERDQLKQHLEELLGEIDRARPPRPAPGNRRYQALCKLADQVRKELGDG